MDLHSQRTICLKLVVVLIVLDDRKSEGKITVSSVSAGVRFLRF